MALSSMAGLPHRLTLLLKTGICYLNNIKHQTMRNVFDPAGYLLRQLMNAEKFAALSKTGGGSLSGYSEITCEISYKVDVLAVSSPVEDPKLLIVTGTREKPAGLATTAASHVCWLISTPAGKETLLAEVAEVKQLLRASSGAFEKTVCEQFANMAFLVPLSEIRSIALVLDRGEPGPGAAKPGEGAR
jgi:hypothetical protein